MRRYFIAAVVVVALALPAAAVAKGPISASISGPGLEGPLVIKGDGEGPGTALGTLASTSGFFAQMYGATGPGTLKARPNLKLGPRYQVTYRVPGQDGDCSGRLTYRVRTGWRQPGKLLVDR